MTTRQRTLIYNILYWAGMLWFVYWCYRTAADNVQYGAAVPYLITAVAPCACLTIWKRWYTGRWIS